MDADVLLRAAVEINPHNPIIIELKNKVQEDAADKVRSSSSARLSLILTLGHRPLAT